MANDTAKLTLSGQPEKGEKSWKVKLVAGGEYSIPFSTITAYNPATKILEVETWLLKDRGIKYKV